MKSSIKQRRFNALARLEAQLKAGTKPEKGLHPLTAATTGGNPVQLTDSDKKRIEKEITTLKSKV